MSISLADAVSQIDAKAFFESHGCVVSGKPTNSKEGREYASSCPICSGVDRFSFWPETGRWHCIRGCGIHGSSVYWFARDVLGMTHQQALTELGVDISDIDSYSHSPQVKLPLFLLTDEPPCSAWIDAAHTFCHMAEKYLWSAKGETALAYLHSRGFTDQTIKQAHLGLCPDWYKAPLEDWGLDASQLMKTDDPLIKIPRGIVIPYYVNGSIHKIQLRRPDGTYFEILGSSEPLYSLAPIEDRPVLLVESEFDALSAHQEASDLICCVATGGTPKGRNPRNVTQLHMASKILQGFDDDPAGEKAAAEWQELIPSIIRHAPWAHDVNDMLKDELPIRAWVELGLSNCEPEQGETLEEFWESAQPPALETIEPELPVEPIYTAEERAAFVVEFTQWKQGQPGEYAAWLAKLNRDIQYEIACKNPGWSMEAAIKQKRSSSVVLDW